MNPGAPGYLGPPVPNPDDRRIHGVLVKQENQVDGNGKAVRHLVVTFFVGSHGPFTHVVDLATFDPAQVQQALQAFAAKLVQLQTIT